MSIDTPPPPDAFEKRLRFGCGAIFGAITTFFVAIREVQEFTGPFWATVIACAMIFGFLALRFGDAFWRVICKLFATSRWW